MRQNSYLNLILTVIAVLLGLNLLTRAGDSGLTAAASAQPNPSRGDPTVTPPFNSTEDRKTVIAQLDTIMQRLSSIEGKLDKGINVTVVKMPPISLAGDKKPDDRKEHNPDTKVEVKKDGSGKQ